MSKTSLPTWSPLALRHALDDLGWTQARLAAELGVDAGRIARWLAGATPEPEVFVRLAGALRVPTTDLAPLSSVPTLLERRWHAGFTIATLAERVGLSSQYVGAVLRGARGLSRESLPRWADALGISPAEVQSAWESTRAHLLSSN